MIKEAALPAGFIEDEGIDTLPPWLDQAVKPQKGRFSFNTPELRGYVTKDRIFASGKPQMPPVNPVNVTQLEPEVTSMPGEVAQISPADAAVPLPEGFVEGEGIVEASEPVTPPTEAPKAVDQSKSTPMPEQKIASMGVEVEGVPDDGLYDKYVQTVRERLGTAKPGSEEQKELQRRWEAIKQVVQNEIALTQGDYGRGEAVYKEKMADALGGETFVNEFWAPMYRAGTAALGGYSMGSTDVMFDLAEKALGVEGIQDEGSGSERVARSLLRTATGLQAGRKMAAKLSSIGAVKNIANPYTQQLLIRTANGLMFGTSNSLSGYATGKLSAKDAAVNWAQSLVSSAVSVIPEAYVPSKVWNGISQIVLDFTTDIMFDAGFRDNLLNKGFAKWLIEDELYNLIPSMVGALGDWSDPQFKVRQKQLREGAGQFPADIKAVLTREKTRIKNRIAEESGKVVGPQATTKDVEGVSDVKPGQPEGAVEKVSNARKTVEEIEALASGKKVAVEQVKVDAEGEAKQQEAVVKDGAELEAVKPVGEKAEEIVEPVRPRTAAERFAEFRKRGMSAEKAAYEIDREKAEYGDNPWPPPEGTLTRDEIVRERIKANRDVKARKVEEGRKRSEPLLKKAEKEIDKLEKQLAAENKKRKPNPEKIKVLSKELEKVRGRKYYHSWVIRGKPSNAMKGTIDKGEITPLRRMILDEGGIAAYKKRQNGSRPWAEEYSGVPPKYRAAPGRGQKLDQMLEEAKRRGYINADATESDLIAALSGSQTESSSDDAWIGIMEAEAKWIEDESETRPLSDFTVGSKFKKRGKTFTVTGESEEGILAKSDDGLQETIAWGHNDESGVGEGYYRIDERSYEAGSKQQDVDVVKSEDAGAAQSDESVPFSIRRKTSVSDNNKQPELLQDGSFKLLGESDESYEKRKAAEDKAKEKEQLAERERMQGKLFGEDEGKGKKPEQEKVVEKKPVAKKTLDNGITVEEQEDGSLLLSRGKTTKVVAKDDPRHAELSRLIKPQSKEDNDQVRKTLTEAASKLKGAKVKIVDSEAELPEDVRLQSAGGQIEGVYVRRDGTSYVVVENIRPGEEARVLTHEAIIHGGLRTILSDDQLKEVLRNSYLNDVEHNVALARLMKDRKIGKDAALEELMAEIWSQRNANPSLYKRFVAQMREMLRKVFSGMKWTENDIENLVARAATNVKLGIKQKPPIKKGGALFSKVVEDADFDEARDAASFPQRPDDLSDNAAVLEPKRWKEYLKSIEDWSGKSPKVLLFRNKDTKTIFMVSPNTRAAATNDYGEQEGRWRVTYYGYDENGNIDIKPQGHNDYDNKVDAVLDASRWGELPHDGKTLFSVRDDAEVVRKALEYDSSAERQEDMSEYAGLSYQRVNAGNKNVVSSFRPKGDDYVKLSLGEAEKVNRAYDAVLEHNYKAEESNDAFVYSENDIPFAEPSGKFFPSDERSHNIKFIEELDKIDPVLSDKLLKEVYDPGVKLSGAAMAKAREAGYTDMPADISGKVYIEDTNAELFSKRRNKVAESVAEDALEDGDDVGVGIKNRVMSAMLERAGMEDVPKAERVEWQSEVDRATSEMGRDPGAQQRLISDLMTRRRTTVEAWEHAMLDARAVELNERLNVAAGEMEGGLSGGNVREVGARIGAIENELSDLALAAKYAGTATARSLAFRRAMFNDDFTLVSLSARKRAANSGRPLPEAEKARLKKTYEEPNKKLTAELNKAKKEKAKVIDAEKQQDIESLIGRLMSGRTIKVSKQTSDFIDAEALLAREELKKFGFFGDDAEGLFSKKGESEIPLALLERAANIGAKFIKNKKFDLERWKTQMRVALGPKIESSLSSVLELSFRYIEDANNKVLTAETNRRTEAVASKKQSVKKEGADVAPKLSPLEQEKVRVQKRIAALKAKRDGVPEGEPVAGKAKEPVLEDADLAQSKAELAKLQEEFKLDKKISEIESNIAALKDGTYQPKQKRTRVRPIDREIQSKVDQLKALRNKFKSELERDKRNGDDWVEAMRSYLGERKVTLDEKQQASYEQRLREASKMEDGAARDDAIMEVMNEVVQHTPIKAGEWFEQYVYSNMLSGPKTHERNIWGNMVNALVTRPVSLMSGAGESRMDAARYVGAVFKAIISGTAQRAAREAMTSGEQGKFVETMKQVSDDATEVQKKQQLFERRKRIEGPKSWVGRKLWGANTFIGRLMFAEDVYFGSIIEAGEKARLMANGISEDVALDRAKKIADVYLYRDKIVADSDKSLSTIEQLIERAGYGLDHIRQTPGFIGKAIKVGVIPFLRTPVKIAQFNAAFTPLSYISANRNRIAKARFGDDNTYDAMVKKLEAEIAKQEPDMELVNKLEGDIDAVDTTSAERYAKANTGLFLTTLGMVLAASGNTTWAAPNDAKAKKLFFDAGYKPYSFRIPGTNRWIPMLYLGPGALALMMPAAFRETWLSNPDTVSDNVMQKMFKTALSIPLMMLDQLPLEGLSSIYNTIQGREDWNLNKIVGRSVLQVTPASGLLSWIKELVDPKLRKGPTVGDTIKAKIPGLSESVDALKNSDNLDATITLADALLPYKIGETDEDYEERYQKRLDKLRANARRLRAKKQGDKERKALLKETYGR